MDMLYDNLENYDEERTILELRRENNELKLQLEEYSTALNKLQKDFDLLSSEHKKLELNYSSLLKTAKAEIERKTAIITSLNIEKDAMVLNSIQNRSTPHFKRNFSKDIHTTKEESKLEKSKKCSTVDHDSNKSSFISINSNERKTHSTSSAANTHSSCITSRLLALANSVIRNHPVTRSSAKLEDRNITRNNEVKENIEVKHDDKTKSRALIRNRRKSMPTFSMEKFSTDEEDIGCAASPKNLKPNEYSERSFRDTSANVKPNSEDRTGYRDSLREPPRSRHGRHFESDRFRGRDWHDPSQRYKRNQSTDRLRLRSRDHSEDRHHRSEYDGDRRKRFDSPSRDKYNHHRSRDFVRSKERNNSDAHKSHHESLSERNHLQERDKCQSQCPERQTSKHKILHEYEEPSCKRMKTDSHGHEEDRCRNERQVDKLERHELYDQFNEISCQSPDDYTHAEVTPSNQTREIKLYATMKLEDPRISSKKYVLDSCDGRPELFTVDSANVDVRVIDKSRWNMIEQVKMPDALIRKPREPTEHSVKIRNIDINVKDTSNWGNDQSKMPGALVPQPKHATELSSGKIRNIENEITKPGCENTKTGISPDIEKIHVLSTVKRTNIEMDVNKTTRDNPNIYISSDSVESIHANDSYKVGRKTMENEVVRDYTNTKQSPHTEKPKNTDDIIKDIYMDVDNLSDMSSMESGELFSFDDDQTHNDKKVYFQPMKSVDEPQKTLKSQTLGDYKIPKKNNIRSLKIDKSKDVPSDGESNDCIPISENTKSQTDSSNLPSLKMVRKITAKEIIEEDLELSDENIDLTEALEESDERHVMRRKSIDKNPESKAYSKIELDAKQELEASVNKKVVEKTKEEIKPVNNKSKEISEKDDKQHKAKKKSLKLKVTRESNENKNLAPGTGKMDNNRKNTTNDLSLDTQSLVIEKPAKKKDKACKTKKLPQNSDVETVSKTYEKKETENKHLPLNTNTFSNSDNTVNKKEKEPSTNEPFQSREDIPIRDKIIETTVNTDATSTLDKPIKKKKKESKPKEDSKDAATKTDKTLESSANRDDVLTVKTKPVKKKEKEPKEPQVLKKKEREKLKSTSAVTESPTLKPVNTKLKETNPKFSELFGDTTNSSLISPEDLGIAPAVVQPNYLPIFEDAQDAIDLNAMKAKIPTPTLPILENTDKQGIIINVEKPSVNKYFNKQNIKETEPKESAPAHSMYRNILPENSPKENNIVKTFIISSGVQQQSPLEDAEVSFANDNRADPHVMKCVNPIVSQNDVLLQALATSTPLKWQPNAVHMEMDSKISVHSTENINASESTPVIDNSDSNTLDSQPNNAEPDVRIILNKKRRRKLLKK